MNHLKYQNLNLKNAQNSHQKKKKSQRSSKKEEKEKALARPDRKPNMKNGVDVMRNKKDDEHFASDFEYKAKEPRSRY